MQAFDLIAQCQKILKIPSVSSRDPKKHQGNREVVRFLVSLAKNFDLQSRVVPNPKNKKDELVFIWPSSQKFPTRGGLALHTHLDTVGPGAFKDWTEAAPFDGKICGDQLIGVGAADVKCDSLCKLSALAANPNTCAYFVGSYSEEVGMLGARQLAAEKIIHPEFALVGEPSEGNLSYANKGFAVLWGKIPFTPEKYSGAKSEKFFEGKSAHSSAPSKGVNALHLALSSLEKNSDLPIAEFSGSIGDNVIPGNFQLTSGRDRIPASALSELTSIWKKFQSWTKSLEKVENALFTPATATSNWTQLYREKNEIIFKIDLRFLPEQDALELAKDFIAASNGKIKLERESPSFMQSPKNSFGTRLRPLLSPGKKFITKSGSNEAKFYQDLGAEVFVHAPGKSYGNIHSPNEKVGIADLIEASAFYSRVVETFAS